MNSKVRFIIKLGAVILLSFVGYVDGFVHERTTRVRTIPSVESSLLSSLSSSLLSNGSDNNNYNNNINNDNTDMISKFRHNIDGKLILAPLTKGGNYPFRQLCVDLFGLQVSVSEMVFARHLLKGDRIESNRMRRYPPATNANNNNNGHQSLFGVQIATNNVEEGLGAIELAKQAGADFVDLNCGCPIDEATRRGLGSSLLRSPKKLGALVSGLVNGQVTSSSSSSTSSTVLPVTVKVRLSPAGVNSINIDEIVRHVQQAGAAAVTIHARTARDRYRRPADWSQIAKVVTDHQAATTGLPIIGNGDILTNQEARLRMEQTGVSACMVGRSALIKPWIFQEFNDQQDWNPSVEDRIEVYHALTTYMKDYFGDDDLGRSKTWKFLPWHFSFFKQYVPSSWTDDESPNDDTTTPLIQRRVQIPKDAPPIEILLSHGSEDTHDLISDALWKSSSSKDAIQRLHQLAESSEFRDIQTNFYQYHLLQEQEARDNSRDDGSDSIISVGAGGPDDVTELSNIPSSTKRKTYPRRRRRSQKPDRTPEEIAAIRAERAAKKARLEAEAKAQAAAEAAEAASA